MSSHEIAIVVLSAILAAAWVPIAVHFWKSWKRRGSPLSLAICALIGFPIFTNVSSAVFLTGNEVQTVLAMVGTNMLLLLNFAICFRWQKERFPDARSRFPKPSSPPDFWKIPGVKEESNEGPSENSTLDEEEKTPQRS